MSIHICFHGIGHCRAEREPGEAGYWMAEDEFLRTADALAETPGVVLSFDDGNRSDVDIALPALRERGLRATFFPVAGRLDDPASLNAGDLAALREAGMGIGSHGWDHVSWRGLTAAGARRELVEAKIALEEASGGLITQAALPLGRYDRRLLHRLRRAGYAAVYTSDRYRSGERSWLCARYSVSSADTAESIRRLALDRPGAREVRNALASAVKRLR